MAAKKEFVIIGNGTASMHCIKALRECGYQGGITVLSETKLPCYNPMLTTYYMAGKIPLRQCFPYGANHSFYRNYRVNLKTNSPVTELDSINRRITATGGKVYHYDRCLVASGSSPVVPPIEGLDSPGIFTVRTINSAVQMKKALKGGSKRVLVLGASMIGIKIVEMCLNMGLETYLADMGSYVFPIAAHQNCAGLIEHKLDQLGVRLILEARLKQVEPGRTGLISHFDGEGSRSVETDLVIVCIGVRSNMQFVNPEQIAMDRGILVDERMQTSAEDVFAAGDVTQGTNLLSGNRELIGLWANANYQGRTAGRNMAGVPYNYPGTVPGNITRFLGMTFVGIGDPNITEKEEEFSCSETLVYNRLNWKAGKLIGANLLNSFVDSGIIRQNIMRNCLQGGETDDSHEGEGLWNIGRFLYNRAVRITE